MKKNSLRHLGNSFAALSCICIFVASSASAVLVTWELNPSGIDAPVGSSSVTYNQQGPAYSFTGNGFTVNGGGDTPLDLYFKNQGLDETGLGIVGPSDHELQGSGSSPFQYIQFDFGKLIASAEVLGGAFEIGSVQSSSNDTFTFYGSNTLGTLGTQITGTYDSTSDMVFLSIPNWGAFRYISVGALSGDVLPVAFQANCIPEMSALFPIVGLIAAVSFTQLLRRRRSAKLSGSPSSGG